MKDQNLAFLFGIAFGLYFMVYPAVYFVYNYFAGETGLTRIPGFWVGMAGFFLINVATSFLKRIFK